MTELADKTGVSPAQLVLGRHLGNGTIVIPKSTHPRCIRKNLAAATITFSPDELGTITALDSGARIGPDPAQASFSQM